MTTGTHGEGDEGQPDPGQAGAQQEEGQLLPRTRSVKGSCSTVSRQPLHAELSAPRSWPSRAPARRSAPGRCCPRSSPASCVSSVEEQGAQSERNGAVGEHQHDPDCGRQRVRLRDDRRHRVGEDELGGETGDALRDRSESRMGARQRARRRRPRWRRRYGGSRCRCPVRGARRAPGTPPTMPPPGARPVGPERRRGRAAREHRLALEEGDEAERLADRRGCRARPRRPWPSAARRGAAWQPGTSGSSRCRTRRSWPGRRGRPG